MKGDQRIIDRVQHRAQTARHETGVRRRDQIARGIGQRAVQIENHRAHRVPAFPSPVTTPKDSVNALPLRPDMVWVKRRRAEEKAP